MSNATLTIRLPASGSQDFEPRLLALFRELERAGEIKPGAIADAWILHDEWCAVDHGDPCNCNLAIEIDLRAFFGLDDGGGADRGDSLENAGTGCRTSRQGEF